MRQSVLQGTLAKCSGQAAISEGPQLAGGMADLPLKPASQTSKNGGPSAVGSSKVVSKIRKMDIADI